MRDQPDPGKSLRRDSANCPQPTDEERKSLHRTDETLWRMLAASPDEAVPDEAVEARADAAAEADVKAGRVVAHETVREWLARLIKGEKVPPPSA